MENSRFGLSASWQLAMACVCALLAIGLALLGFSPTQASRVPTLTGQPGNASAMSLGSSPVITIGVAADLTGAYASQLGWPVANSVQLAISQTNAAGGISVGGVTYTLSLVMADSAAGSACNAAQAVTAANTLLSAGAVAVVGHTCSEETRSAEPIYFAAGVPLFCASCTAPDVTHQGYNIMFRTVTQDGAPASLLATHFRKWLRLGRTAIVEDSPSSQRGNAYRNTFVALGGTISTRQAVMNSSDFASALNAIKAANVDSIAVLDINLDQAAAGQFSQQAYSVGLTNVVIGWSTWTNDESVLTTYASSAGATAAQGDFAAMEFRRTQDMPGWPSYSAAYTAAGFPNATTTPGTFGPFGYDAARIIIAAMPRAGSTMPSAIRSAIASTQNYQGVVGTYRGFDPYGDAIPQWDWLEQYQNGQWVLLNPSQLSLPLVLR